jgi:uncharacterized phage-associated protein
MQLLKLVYIVYGWGLALLDRRLFESRIEAWRLGPVVPQLYYQVQRFGADPVDRFLVSAQTYEPTGEIVGKTIPVIDPMDKEALAVVQSVWDAYKNKRAFDLSDLTHEMGSPWQKVYKPRENNELRDEDIRQRSLAGIERIYGSNANKQ